jgi:hypothetical protein
LGKFLKISDVAQIVGLLFSLVTFILTILTKIGLASCRATFSQTHLVTLFVNFQHAETRHGAAISA